MALTVKHARNRWCIKSPLGWNGSPPVHGEDPPRQPRFRGRPPAKHACKPERCVDWQPIDRDTGTCSVRDKLRARKNER